MFEGESEHVKQKVDKKYCRLKAKYAKARERLRAVNNSTT
ncbi:hypothetical protein AZE42_14062 [Rhizopogon vesiculosus]|uniref:Uncharacterized protein n=1 Tax=Rhizopogon vesiculosus TaxID=180088 RepID=A0A1J8R7F6_9AGAM|nr:hypothetical protein AZE42_14062 [Rhizopogon vesiculosus]